MNSYNSWEKMVLKLRRNLSSILKLIINSQDFQKLVWKKQRAELQYRSRHKTWIPDKKWQLKNIMDSRKNFENFIKILMYLNYLNVFQRKFSCLIFNFINYLNKFESVWFDRFQSCFKLTILKCFRTSVIFIFPNVLNWA